MKAIREAYGEALAELGKINNDIVVLDADVSTSTRSVLFKNAAPERFFNVGIAENNMVAMAAGFASCGKVPFVNTFAFLLTLRAADPVRSLIAYNNLNVKLAGAYGGFSDSYDGASHQSVEDISIMRSMPNMTVCVVSDEIITKKAVEAAAEYYGPVYLRLSRNETPNIYDSSQEFTIGRGIMLKEGTDVTIISNGLMVCRALDAAQELEKSGIRADVIDMHTVKPLDVDLLITRAAKTGAIVTVEEHNVIGGLGSAVSEALARYYPVPVEMVGIGDCFGESGALEELLDKHKLNKGGIIQAVKAVISRK